MNTLRLRSRLIRNEDPPKKVLANLTCNLLPKKVRIDNMEGREHIVVPMVILTEGVHNGSGGPLYYPPDELSKTPVVWNHKPIVVYHPEMNGQGVSACDPAILTNRKVGVMMNTKWDNKRLTSEAWLEKSRADAVDERIMAAVENNTMMEVSTGLFVDLEEKEGEWNGEKYTAITRNYRPDHLAILPDKIGACSIAKGAGFLRNEKNGSFAQALDAIRRVLGLTSNELSFAHIREGLNMALRKKFNVGEGTSGSWLYVEDCYSNFCIYDYNGKLYSIGYTATDTGVSLSDDDPKQVFRVTEYRTVEGAAYVGNRDQNHAVTKEKTMEKKKLVDNIVANTAGGWSEADRETLMAMSEAQLKRIATAPASEGNQTGTQQTNNAGTGQQTGTQNATAQNTTAANGTSTTNTPATPQDPKVVTIDDYLKAAPANVREVLSNSMEVYAEEKKRLIDAITANKSNRFTKEDLGNRPLSELRMLAELAGAGTPVPRSPNYAGQGQVMADNSAVTEEPVLMPTINFENK